MGRAPELSAAMIDSQSVKTTELADSRGFDGNKRIKGHKRHVAVDISGIPLMVKVTDANASDSKVLTIFWNRCLAGSFRFR